MRYLEMELKVKAVLKSSVTTLLAGALMILGWAAAANANTFDFNFSSATYSSSATNNTTTGAGAAATAIQTYMDSVLAADGCTGCTVTVLGGVTDETWDGDGHVVGKGGDPLTLGTYTGAASALSNSITNTSTPSGVLGTSNNLVSGTVSKYLADTNDSGTQVGIASNNNEISIKFNFPVSGTISFDYEIFPCATGGCTTPPGLTFYAGNGTNGVGDTLVSSFVGVTPSSPGSVKSPDSSDESSDQSVGYYSTTISNDSEIDFEDWPATIGIDNLTITTVSTPEPSSILLLGAGLVALFIMRKKMLQRGGTIA